VTHQKTIGCIELWQAVVHLALSDALCKLDKNALYQRKAMNWIQRGGTDFCLVCELAGYSPQNVREKLLLLMDKRDKKGKR